MYWKGRKGFVKLRYLLIVFVFIVGILALKLKLLTTRSSSLNAFVKESNMYSRNAILVDLEEGEILFEKNADEKMYPASLTKMMTLLVALEEMENPEEKIKMPSNIYEYLYSENASIAGFKPNEIVPVQDLYYGMILPSGAECCISIAEHISESESKYVKKMNQKGKTIGMRNTHFTNTTGLHDNEHYSTVKDMAKLMQAGLKNQKFREVLTTKIHQTQGTEKHENGFEMKSTLFEKLENMESFGIEGGKTGYTDKAGLCLATFAKVDGKEYILVTAGAAGSHQTEPYHILDAQYVYRSIKNNFSEAHHFSVVESKLSAFIRKLKNLANEF